MGSKRGYQEQESGEFVMQNCRHCKGLTIESSYHDYGVWHREFRCINCGRYYPTDVRSIEIPPDMMGRTEKKRSKPFKRMTEAELSQAKELLDAGQSVSKAARWHGVNRRAPRNNRVFRLWQVVQGK